MSDCDTIDYLRRPKVANMALFDWVATFGVVFLLTWLIDGKAETFLVLAVVAIMLFVIIHKATSTPTMFNYYLGLNNKEDALKRRKNC